MENYWEIRSFLDFQFVSPLHGGLGFVFGWGLDGNWKIGEKIAK